MGDSARSDIALAADHRASDGYTGGRFLAALARHLQEPPSP
jgi:pyruvate/2-oxoglutarate dehydrogenase complex dihydrolipoamide acyltransferase (E2) component